MYKRQDQYTHDASVSKTFIPPDFVNNGDVLEGLKIKSVTDFGIFVDLEGGIDGLIHHSEIDTGTQSIEEVYKEGQAINVSISGMDSERERISLTLLS